MLHPLKLASLSLCLLVVACGRTAPTEAPAAPTAAAAAAGPALPTAVQDYLAELKAVEAAKAPVSLEALFAKAEGAQNALMEVTGDQAVLERYSDAEFSTLQSTVRGLKLHRKLEIYAQPEPAFFLALAMAHGQPTDVAFFEQYVASMGDDLVPRYLKLRPQPSPCVRFDEGVIEPLYAGWRALAAAQPQAYSTTTQQNIADLEEALVLGTCACAGVESVQKEQAAFVARYPDNPKVAAIKARSAQLISDPDAVPVNCR